MNRNEFQGMCDLLKDGRMTWVENHQNHLQGRVVGCEEDRIEVDIGNRCEVWERQDCSEMTHGYKIDYQEVEKHPHEYDSHLD